MRIRTTALVMVIIFGILPYVGAAIPGITITTNPPSISIINGNIILDYNVTITNEDDGTWDDASQQFKPNINKTITDLIVTPQFDPPWEYQFTNPRGYILSDITGQNITTTVHVKVPNSITSQAKEQVFEHQINASVTYELYPDCMADNNDPDICILSEYEPVIVNTVILPTAPIPEFPTIALPVISALGIMLLMHRRKRKSS